METKFEITNQNINTQFEFDGENVIIQGNFVKTDKDGNLKSVQGNVFAKNEDGTIGKGIGTPEPRPHSQEEAHLLSSEGRGRWPPPRSGLGVRAEPGRSGRSEAGGQPKPAPPQLQARVEPKQSRCKRV